MRSKRWLLPLLALAALALAPSGAAKGSATGSFRDRDGRTHTWEIQRTHTLVWDGEPYVPVGVAIASAHLAAPSAENLAADEATLDRLRAAGVRDVWIDARRPLVDCPVAAIQQLIDALEQRGFRYGLAIQGRDLAPMVGTAALGEPIPIAAGELRPGATFRREVAAPDALRVHYTLVLMIDPEQGEPVASGTARVEQGKAIIEIPLPANRALLSRFAANLWLAAERDVAADEATGFADLWSGLRQYQERLIEHLGRLRFGPGLRFLVSPFDAGAGLQGAEETVVPASEAFRTAFAAWLKENVGPSQLSIRWGMRGRATYDMSVAARLVPTWHAGDPPGGFCWLMDPIGGQSYAVTPRRSRFWRDLHDFRAASLRRAMDEIAVALKQAGFDLPILFEWDGYHPVFANTPSPMGYDGLACVVRGRGPSLATDVGAAALALAEESDRNTWIVAARMRAEAPGYASVDPFRQDCATLAEAYFRGFFIDGTASRDAALAAAAIVGSAGPPPVTDRVPATCFFPALLPNLGQPRRFDNGVWWLPSVATARQVVLGDDLAGYEIAWPFGRDRADVRSGIVLWSRTGKQPVTFYVRGAAEIVVMDTAGRELRRQKGRDQVRLEVGPEPLVVSGLDAASIFPLEEARAMLDEFESLLRLAEARRINTTALRTMVRDARNQLRPATAAHIRDLVQEPLQNLRQVLSPYVWIEGERPIQHNFQGVAFQNGASEGGYLKLERLRPPRRGSYRARYAFVIGQEATYDIWVAGTPPGPGTSPIVWSVDGGGELTVAQAQPTGDPYAPGFAWFQLGQVTLREGRHILDLAIPEPVGSPPTFRAGIDVVMLAREPFRPEGTRKPFPLQGRGTDEPPRPRDGRREPRPNPRDR